MKFRLWIRSIAASAALVFALSVVAFGGEAQGVTVNVDGSALNTDVGASITEGRTMVPMRAIFEALEAEVQWSAADKTITAVKGDTVIKMTVGAPYFERNGGRIELDTPAVIVNNRTLVPARAVSESLGGTVEWNAETKTVDIYSGAAAETETKTEAETETKTETTTEAETGEADEVLRPAEWMSDISDRVKRPEQLYDKLADDSVAADWHDRARYSFEHGYLPGRLFEDEKKTGEAMEDDAAFKELVSDVWDELVNDAVLAFAVEDEENEYVVGSAEDYIKLSAQLKDRLHLGLEENISAGAITADDGTRVGVIGVADDRGDVGCAYIAVLYDEAKGLRIYTLEREDYFEGYMVCFVTDVSRGNYAVVIKEKGAKTAEAFLVAVTEIEKNGIEPVATFRVDF